MAHVYALVADLFFGDRIERALQQLGHQATMHDASQGDTGAPPPDIELALVDLEAGAPALEAIRAARALSVPVLCFGPHTDLALREGALQAGATQVVAKSRFVSDFPGLVNRLLQG